MRQARGHKLREMEGERNRGGRLISLARKPFTEANRALEPFSVTLALVSVLLHRLSVFVFATLCLCRLQGAFSRCGGGFETQRCENRGTNVTNGRRDPSKRKETLPLLVSTALFERPCDYSLTGKCYCVR